MDVVYYAMNIGLFSVLFLHTNVIAGWTKDQMMIFVSAYLVADAISMTIFSNNLWWLPVYINRGELDYYLIRPVSPLFFLSLREFAANSFINLLMAGGYFCYTILTYPGEWSLSSLPGFILLIINGTLIHYCLQMIMVIPVFWTHSARGFMDLFYTLGVAMERPHKIFHGWQRLLFTVILPFGLIASLPAQYFIEGFTFMDLAHVTLVTIGIWALMLFLWRQGLKNYSSASS
jgi:ABC-2 type transport system permease protein